MKADWYFDFVSPFSYLQLADFHRLPAALEITYRPVLFAGLLAHWGHKGPAEIGPKRTQTYRLCQWRAAREDIPFKMPPVHPFNPLKPLRLCIALDNDPRCVRRIFDFIFGEGRDVQRPEEWAALARTLGVEAPDSTVSRDEVKAALRANTEAAAARGVYGVPTFAVGGELFWGADLTDMLLDFLADPGLFRRGDMARISDMPMGIERN